LLAQEPHSLRLSSLQVYPSSCTCQKELPRAIVVAFYH
jgi:hypothetical protein